MTLFITYSIAWLAMVFIAIANGIIREKFMSKSFSELSAHQISTAFLILFFAVFIWMVVRIQPPASDSHALLIGLCWLTATISFEFLFGHFIAGHSWTSLLNDYNILEGRIWSLVLIWVFIAPFVFYKVK